MMRTLHLTALAALLSLAVCTHTAHAEQAVTEEAMQDPIATWLGSYEGDLQAYNPGRGPAVFPMRLDILEDTSEEAVEGTRIWRITYGVGERADVRDYRIVTRDQENGLYAIDERNSIVIPAYLTGDALSSNFRLDTTVIVLSYTRMDEDTIRFDLTSWDSDDLETSGGEGAIPEIVSPRMTGYQTCVLTRVQKDETDEADQDAPADEEAPADG